MSPIRDLSSLLLAIESGFQPKYLFFWGHQPRKDGLISKECFSQWWVRSFEIDGITYPTAEHWMMAEKARLFGDADLIPQILETPNPAVAKKLGRMVRDFDDAIWIQHRFDIVVRGNLAKFGQNSQLQEFLLKTGDRVLVEASPLDRIWGIGLAANDPNADKPANWQGLNLLGFALMKVRCGLRNP